MKKLIVILFILPLCIFAQKSDPALEKQARKYVREGNVLYDAQKYADAEVAYKKALENSPNYETANYNLGNALLQQNRNKEAIAQYEVVTKITKDKFTKGQTFHNIGNSYFKEKDYQNSVNAYKNSLRNNPKDEETRYNLALAQEMLEDQQQQDKDEENKDDQNKDEEQKEDQENKDQNKDEDQEGDQNEDQQNKDQQENDKKEEQEQPQQGQLSPQQIQQLLEAMNNEEKKTQEKMNAKKEKGKKVKQEKDW